MSDQPAFNFGGSVGKLNINSSSGTQITGDGANVNQGSGTLNVGGQTFGAPATVEKVFNDMAEIARTEQPTFEPVPAASPSDDTVDELDVADVYESPAALLEAARDEAAADITAVEPLTLGAFQEKQNVWAERFKWIAPRVLKIAMVSGQAALENYAPTSAVIAALKAAVSVINE